MVESGTTEKREWTGTLRGLSLRFLNAFAKRTGCQMTAGELGAVFDNPTPENEHLRKAFAEVSRESLVQFCRRLRSAVDEVDPSVRICLCQSAQVDIDGDTTEADVRAPVRRIDNPINSNFGYAFEMPERFRRNPYADAFEMEF